MELAVLERHHRFFAEQRIDDFDVRTVANSRQRHVGVAAVLVVQHGMAMEERAATAVLADQAQVVVLVDQRGVGEIFGETPVLGCSPAAILARSS